MKETEAFRALSSADRQILLYELITANEPVNERALSREVAARRHQVPPRQVDEEKIKRARVRLVHLHLPMLSELDIIERDSDSVAPIDGTWEDELRHAADILDVWPPDGFLQQSLSWEALQGRQDGDKGSAVR